MKTNNVIRVDIRGLSKKEARSKIEIKAKEAFGPMSAYEYTTEGPILYQKGNYIKQAQDFAVVKQANFYD